MKSLKQVARPYKVVRGSRFRLADYDPADDGNGDLKADASELLKQSIERMSLLQEKLYAQDKWSVLLIFQALDAAGKDSVIKHVMSGLNPQSCEVHPFKAPSAEELDHDFLWRPMRALPRRGHIGIFNRSHYEEVLVVRVHPEFLAKQQLPLSLVTKNIWRQRYEDINGTERYLARQGMLIRKFFLHVSRDEQTKRLRDRLSDPTENWKFRAGDLADRELWDEYTKAYRDALRQCSTAWAPWYVVPADDKKARNYLIARTVVEMLDNLGLRYPRAEREVLKLKRKLK